MAAPRSVRHPLTAQPLATGFTALKAALRLSVRDRRHAFVPMEFRVDSGTNVTSIPVTDAEAARISFPARAVELEVRTAAGRVRQRVHAGHITVRVPGLDGRDFRWPCHFVEYADEGPTPLLGLTGVIADLRIFFDGEYALEAPHGWVILEERTTV